METKKLLGLGLLGGVGYLLWKKGALPGMQAAASPGAASYAVEIAQSGIADPTREAPDYTAARTVSQVGQVASATVGAINPVAGAVVGIASGVAANIIGFFTGVPLEPVAEILIAEMPYAWSERSNIPPGSRIHALDRYGYLHPLVRQDDLGAAGYLDREVIAVNWKVFSMMPQAAAIAHRSELERTKMPRPSRVDVIRGVFGNDTRFYVGAEERVHGPWEASAIVTPLPGSPAMWADFARDYVPTHTDSPGEF